MLSLQSCQPLFMRGVQLVYLMKFLSPVVFNLSGLSVNMCTPFFLLWEEASLYNTFGMVVTDCVYF